MGSFRIPKLALSALALFAVVGGLSLAGVLNGYVVHIVNLSLIYVIL
ncbi:MAG: hypothetical protein JNG85_06800, partial [Spirochaetaceae bacterium]|nr:hypothetical protein [Spirochaetaceae bacterium]